ncbi:MAG: hypothetical protein R3A51_19485 [Nannocystaceae bacterium]|nr:hypothetical protein [Myxococcales bacterium]
MLLRRRPRGLASRSLAALWLALACRLDSESLTQDPSTNASTEATSMTDGATSTTAGATETSETGMSGTASESVGSTSETGETDTASSDSESGTECPEPGYTPGDAAELLADPAAFDRQKLCLEGVFQLNPNAGGCDPSTDGCCSDRPELETATGDISLDFNGMCASSNCGDECPHTSGAALQVWGTLYVSGDAPVLEVDGTNP